MVEIYTPGHNLITDSLIMHGIVRLYGSSVRIVERIGEKYRIELEENPLNKEILQIISEENGIYLKIKNSKDIEYDINGFLENSNFLGKINSSNINIPNLKNWVNDLYISISNFKPVTQVYSDINHKETYNEGRSRSKNFNTLYLPLSLIYGKYEQSGYAIKDIGYSVCDECFLLSNLGLIFGTAIVRTESNEKTSVDLITLVPTKSVRGIDILLLQRFVEGKALNFYNIELTSLASLIYVLSVGETIYSIDFEIEALLWRLQRSKNFQRGLQTTNIKLKELLDKISDIKFKFDSFPNFVDFLVRDKDGALLLHKMAETLIFGGDKYSLIREISRFLLNKYSSSKNEYQSRNCYKDDKNNYCRTLSEYINNMTKLSESL